ncbi:hypothetical protein [Sorangium cellulosum]|nr:hypothetical protein [Sorangium cellulosum]AGP36299.1 hypothetical protein SCE1572_18460 [Sorangium cellulosum So0157-2]
MDLLTLRHASTSMMQRRAWCSYAVHLTEYAWINQEQMKKDRADGLRDTVLDLHWFFHVQLARMAGTFPAWEGIRLVRERSA